MTVILINLNYFSFTPLARAGAGSLSGRLTDRATGLALAGVKVWGQDAGQPRILAKAVTGADGA